MAAAAFGNTISDMMGIGSAWYVESWADRLGMGTFDSDLFYHIIYWLSIDDLSILSFCRITEPITEK